MVAGVLGVLVALALILTSLEIVMEEAFKVVVHLMLVLIEHMVQGTEILYRMELGVDDNFLHQRDHMVEGRLVYYHSL
jgi:hypothetical protein